MWTCPSCGTTNEPHMIFCSSCGVSRHKAPVREPRAALPPDELLAPAGPRFEGTPGGFALRWVGATVGAMVVAWIVHSVISTLVLSQVYRTMGPFGIRMVNVILTTFLFGGALGLFQSSVLKLCLDGRGVRWLEATLAAYFLSGVARMFQPDAALQARSLQTMMLWAGVFGVVGGALLGSFQSLALGQLSPGGWFARWVPVSVGANTLGALAGTAVFYVLFQGDSPAYSRVAAAGFSRSLIHALLTSLPAGLVLGGCLVRLFSSPAEEPR